MSEIGIQVDPETINKYIAEQILDSALGERLKETIDKAVTQLGQYGNDPLKTAVIAEVQRVVRDLVHTEFEGQIRVKVRELLTDEYLSTLIDLGMKFKERDY